VATAAVLASIAAAFSGTRTRAASILPASERSRAYLESGLAHRHAPTMAHGPQIRRPSHEVPLAFLEAHDDAPDVDAKEADTEREIED
jgi:hypothetical protein